MLAQQEQHGIRAGWFGAREYRYRAYNGDHYDIGEDQEHGPPDNGPIKPHQSAATQIGFKADLAKANAGYPPAPDRGFVGGISERQRDDWQRQEPQPPSALEQG